MPTTPTLLDRMIQAERELAEARAASNHIHAIIIEIRARGAEQESAVAREIFVRQELGMLARAKDANRRVSQCLSLLMNLQGQMMAGIST